MQFNTNDYTKHFNKIKANKIKGNLKSTLRKRDPYITYKNLINSEYMFFEYLNLKEYKKMKFKPNLLIVQIILNLLLLVVAYYLLSANLTFL
jgi:hypothetical protein